MGALEQARSMLRRYRLGRLVAAHADRIETRAEGAHFIIDGTSGRLVMAVTRVLLELDEHTLYVPDECLPGQDEALELIVELSHEPHVSEELRDRHLAYHGHMRGGVWVCGEIVSGRFGDELFDGEDLRLVNELAECEARLCRACNGKAAELSTICHQRFGASGTVVGVDPFGLDVRVGSHVRRIEFDGRADSEAAAMAAIEQLLRGERA
ncbi:MAG: hypothetical protein D6695_09860 [Planctomycetota bacterium]|nr:MAG: hypothetical protein D6695_09860 [Planctomycetota bacterium]